MSYVVTSENFSAPFGTSLTGEQLKECNIAALIEGGHLAADTSAQPSTQSDKDEKEQQ